MVALLIRNTFLLEKFAHIVVVQVDGWHHDMAGRLTLQLDDALAKVGLYHFDASFLKIGIHATFLCEHRLRLYHLLHVMVFQDAIDDFVELGSILGPVNLHTVLLGIGGKLVQIFVKMGNGMTLNLRGFLTQLFPLVQAIGHIVALGANSPESGIVPMGVLLVL